MIQDYFKLAVKNLRKRKLRSWLTILGIVISVAIIFVLISLSVGLSDAINKEFKQLGSDKFFIMPKGQLGAPGTGGAVQLTDEDVKTIEKVRGVKQASEIVIGNAEVKFNTQSRFFFAAGIPLDKLSVVAESLNLQVDEGRFLKTGDSGKIDIGSDYKTGNVFSRAIRAGDTLNINGQNFKVEGIMKPIGNPSDDKNVYMSLDDFRKLFNSGNRVDEIIVQVQEGQNLSSVADLTKQRLMKLRGVTEKTIDFNILTPQELLASFSIILNVITGFLVGVASISLLVGGIGVANTMFTSVLERTKEIGTMKAVGATNSDILLIFLIESGLLGLIGGVIGVGLGFGVSKIVEVIAAQQLGTNLLQAAAPAYLIIGCLLFSFLIGSISGVWPARIAANLKTVDALRYE